MELLKKFLWFIAGGGTLIMTLLMTPLIVHFSGINDEQLIGWLVQYLPLFISTVVAVILWRKSKLFAAGIMVTFFAGILLSVWF